MKLDLWNGMKNKCKFRLDAIVCNNKQRWNKNKCRCECKELIDKGICGNGFIWNLSNCECECDRNCGIGEYLDYENCKCNIVIFMIIVFTVFTGVTIYFVYYNWSLIKNNVSCIKFNTRKEAKIW